MVAAIQLNIVLGLIDTGDAQFGKKMTSFEL